MCRCRRVRSLFRGTVADSGERHVARSTAQLVNGVQSVRDKLKVLDPSDTDLRRAVMEALQLDSHLPTTIDVNVHEGSVTLGRVQRQPQRDAVTFIAKTVPGVVDVDNQTSVEDHAHSAGDAGEPFDRALDRLADLEGEGMGEGADSSRIELRGRLASAMHRFERLRSELETAGNVVRFRLARYLEALSRRPSTPSLGSPPLPMSDRTKRASSSEMRSRWRLKSPSLRRNSTRHGRRNATTSTVRWRQRCVRSTRRQRGSRPS